MKNITPQKNVYVVTELKKEKIINIKYFYNLSAAILFFNNECNKKHFSKITLSEEKGKKINVRFSLQERLFLKIKYFLENFTLIFLNFNKKNKF